MARLECVCYKCIIDDDSVDYNAFFDTLSAEMNYLNTLGFKTAMRKEIKGVNMYNLSSKVEEILNYFEDLYDKGSIEYSTDGVVVAIDNLEEFYSMPMDGNARTANFALKMGKVWESNVYSGTIIDIVWEKGKRFLTPKARIEPVVTVTGTEVATVPLYNVGVMYDYGYVPPNEVYFIYGGEQGVKCCTPDGKPISEA